MKRVHVEAPRSAIQSVRCAVYTRKSTEEGLEQEFNSLDAQRESGEAFIASQRHEGWQAIGERYDDGGYTGGNMDRPGLTRLMADIEAGLVDCVVVYKVDRLSRSLLDFARMMQVFESHKVAFVSVTQQFNTATSMGRLVLNVLLSFAQFEREIISERTRDKIAATRRKGKWAGGHPLLGYDVDPNGFKLVINLAEAARVRAIFQLYLEHAALLPVVEELARRGWTCKRWRTRKGHERGGQAFNRTSLYRLLTNVTYLGKVTHKDAVYDGEHEAIVDVDVFDRVYSVLKRNGATGGAPVRNKFGALLRGLIHCAPCGCAMSPTHTTRKGNRRYRYYVCSLAQKRGWATCPSKSIPAAQVEEFVVEQIKCIGRDPMLRADILAQARRQVEAQSSELDHELKGLEKEWATAQSELRTTSLQLQTNGDAAGAVTKLAGLHERIRSMEVRQEELRHQLQVTKRNAIDETKASAALAAFDPVWAALGPREQERVLHLLVGRVDFDGAKETITVAFNPAGIRTLTDELARQSQGRTA